MKAYRSPTSGLYVLEMPVKSKKDVARAMSYRGMNFSTSASQRHTAILFSGNPYSICDLADDNDPDLGPYKREINLSRALDGKGTHRLPPVKELWPYQKAALDYLVARNGGILGSEPGLGKRQPLDEPVLTPWGWSTMGKLLPGHRVIRADGKATRVMEVHPIVESEIWKVTFSDGRTVRCDPEHLWEVQRRKADKFCTEVLTARAISQAGLTRKSGMRNGKDKKLSCFYVPLVEPIEFYNFEPFTIDPYVLGVLIGDGSLTGNNIAISAPDRDIEIIQKVENILLPEFHLNVNRHPACPQYYIQKPDKSASFRHRIVAMGLNVKSPGRFIPEPYFIGSIKERYALLQGLMDTDGSCIRNRTTFHTMSQRLANDVAQLVRSLGGWAKIRPYDRTNEGKGIEYQVNVKTPQNPFSLRRKADAWKPCNIKLGIISIETDGVGLQRCIKIQDPRGLYVSAGFTLTHNTPISIAFCNHVEATRVLVIVPASVRIQWGIRIKEWSTLPNVTVSVMLRVKDGIHPTANYQVISYEAARNPAIMRAIAHGRWDVLICDEAHKMKSADALVTRAVLGNSRGEFQRQGYETVKAIAHYCDRKLALTGTILLNRPSECYCLFRFFDHETINFMTEEQFKIKYNRQANMKTIEGKHFKMESTSLELELQNKLRVNILTRHEKRDVFKDMKVPRYSIVSCLADGKVSAALDVEGMLGLSIDEITTTKDFEILGHISEARRLMGEALAPQVCGYVADLLDGGEEKYVLFGWHLSVLEIYERELAQYGTVMLHGGKNPKARQKAIDDFISDPTIRVFIANLLAGGEGVDGLQKVASRCGLGEPDWVPSRNEQAVSRLDRIGQQFPVSADVFVAPGSIAEKILVKSLEKASVIHRVLDEKEGNRK